MFYLYLTLICHIQLILAYTLTINKKKGGGDATDEYIPNKWIIDCSLRVDIKNVKQ